MNNGTHDTLTPTLLQVGKHHSVVNSTNDNHPASCECTELRQRNWSRVGYGNIMSEGNKLEKYFLKQNVNKRGEFLQKHWEYERLGTSVASQLFRDIVSVPEIKYHNRSSALNIFEYVDVIPFDSLLRQNRNSFDACFPFFLDQITSILTAMKNLDNQFFSERVPIKKRPYGSVSSSLNFKGFDIRNIGITNSHSNHASCSSLVMFDFGRPYLAPIEEAAAKLFISIGLLNWGRPVSRFIKGPDEELLFMTLPYIKEFLDIDSVQAELDLQAKFRSVEIHGAGILERSLKTLGINALGIRYLAKLRRWCNQHIKP